MKRLLFLCSLVLLGLWIGASPTAALTPPLPSDASLSAVRTPIEYELPYPGLLPDHPLYPLKKVRDRILLLFTRTPDRKSQLLHLLSDKKMAMVQVLWDNNKKELAVATAAEAEMNLLSAAVEVQGLKQRNILSVGVAENMDLAARKHEEMLLTLMAESSGEQQTLIQQTIAVTHQAMQLISFAKN